MKRVLKIIILVITSSFLLGCNSNKVEELSKEKEIYQNYVKKTQNIKKTSSEEFPFDINVKYDKITKDEVRYQIVIDNPKKEIKNISAVAVHDKQTDDVFPSIGIFEKKQKLIPNKKPSGIILVGYIPYTKSVKSFECTIKLLIRFSDEEKTQTLYYVTKKS